MANEVIWTRSKYILMCEEGMLSEIDARILEQHIKGASRLEISQHEHVDIRVVDERMNRLKRKYDALQKEFPDILDPRNADVYSKNHRKKVQ